MFYASKVVFFRVRVDSASYSHFFSFLERFNKNTEEIRFLLQLPATPISKPDPNCQILMRPKLKLRDSNFIELPALEWFFTRHEESNEELVEKSVKCQAEMKETDFV